jgi:glutamyl-tRNA synthetase
MYARAKGGKFILRIEDTDKTRSKQEFVDEILYSLKWLGFDWDEIYYQSERFDIYRQYADKLLKEEKAYIEKSPEKGEAVIFRVTPRKIRMDDLIRGEIEFDSSVIKDQVLIKSDGTPTYNFAVVVDDATMGITHIIRGDDHISNTPKQILLYEAMGFPVPRFAHLPLIMGTEGRLSKRTGATAVSDYRRMGYLSEAIVNYLLLLSWSPGDNREVIDIKEAIKLFDIAAVNKTAAAFDLKKLDWMNNQYLKKEDPEKLYAELLPELVENKLVDKDSPNKDYIISVIKLFQPRLYNLGDFARYADSFFLEEPIMDPEAERKYLSRDFSGEFRAFCERIDKLEKFDIVFIEEAFRRMIAELNIEAKILIHPIRVALTGKTVGPGLFEVIYYLGKERTCKRLSRWVKG